MKHMHTPFPRVHQFVKNAIHFLAGSPGLAGLVVFVGILMIGWVFCIQRTVRVRICLDHPTTGGIQVFFRTEPYQLFTETRSVSIRAAGIPAVANVDIPARQLCGLKLVFCPSPEEFAILGGQVGNIPLPPWKKWSFSSDVTLDMGESNELKIRSSGAEPCMTVSFRRPIPSSSKPKALSRERLMLLLFLALAAAILATMGLSKRPRTDLRVPLEHRNADFSWICLLFAIAFFFFVGVRMASRGCDMGVHTAMASGISLEDLRHPLLFWKHNYYPMWHLLVKLFIVVFHVNGVLAAGLVNGLCYNACLIGIYVYLRRTFRNVDPCGLIGMAFAVCTVGCMLGPWVDIDHLYENTQNKWHNPTHAMVKTLALPCVLLTARLWDGLSDRWMNRICMSPSDAASDRRLQMPWPQVIALGAILTLTELAKPSFIQVYLPAMFLFFAGCSFVNRKSIVPSLVLSLSWIAPCLVLLSQCILAFDSEGSGGIGFGFMEVIGHYKHAGLNQFYAVAFPVVALMVTFFRRKVHTEDILCWLMFLIGMFMRLFLFELGPRMLHGNLGWGYCVALYLVWVTGIRQYVDLAVEQNNLRSRLEFWILSIFLFLHVLTGFYKMYDMMCLGSMT